MARVQHHGHNNTANGSVALYSNTSGNENTADGGGALYSNTMGRQHCLGFNALYSNTDGNNNTAIGADALYSNTQGRNNTALGFSAGINLTFGDNNIDIGSPGVDGDFNTIRIGGDNGTGFGPQTAIFISGINGVDKSSGSPVFIDANGQLGTGTALQGPTGPTGRPLVQWERLAQPAQLDKRN